MATLLAHRPGLSTHRTFLPCAWAYVLTLLLCPPICPAADPPQRIVSINLVSDIILIDLVPPERIAALSRLASHPHLSLIHDRVGTIRTTTGSAEEVMALHPDLVVGARWGQGPTLELLHRLGVSTHILSLAESYAEITQLIQDLAEAVGEPTRGAQLIEQMQAARNALHSSHSPPAPRALLFGSSGFSGGHSLLTDEVLIDAGLRRGTAGRVDLEHLVLRPPHVLVDVVYRPEYPTQTDLLLKHPALRRIQPEMRRVPLTHLLNATHRTPEASQAIHQPLAP